MEKRHKLKIANYKVMVDNKEEDFLVRVSLVALLFDPELRLGWREAIRNDGIAKNIENCPEDFILLTLDDYGIIKGAVDQFTNFNRHAVELINRVHNAEEIEVEVKEKIEKKNRDRKVSKSL